MLVLSRKSGESIVVPGCDLKITVVKVVGQRVRLTIEAPSEIAVHREEVWLRDAFRCTSVVDTPPTPAVSLPR